MSRRIVTTPAKGLGAARPVDTYFDKVVKNIPADIVAAWVTVTGLISAASDVPVATVLWIAFVFGMVLTFFWTLRQTREPGQPPAYTQSAIAAGAFVVWVMALGGPFATLAFYRPLYGSLLLIAYSLAVAVINPPES